MLLRRTFLAGLSALFLSPAARAETPMFYVDEGMALSGYDVITYFDAAGPQRGQREFAVMWKGAIWLFETNENREAFEANPRAYAPQFGGYCAYAVAQGRLLSSDPRVWRIVDGKLYLTHSPAVERVWAQDVPGHVAMAEANWPAVLYD